jgi:hypothetical protein
VRKHNRTALRPSDAPRITELSLAFWESGVLAFPAGSQHTKNLKLPLKNLAVAGPVREVISKIPPTTHSQNRITAFHRFTTMMMRTSGALESGDITPGVLGKDSGSIIANAIMVLHLDTYGDAVQHTLEDFGCGSTGTLKDLEFKWLIDRDPTMVDWQSLAAQYVATLHTNLAGRNATLGVFFRYLLSNPSIPRHPIAFLKRGAKLQPPFIATSAVVANRLADFLDWVLDTRFSMEDDDGRPTRFPDLCNPVERITSTGQALVETCREAMPTRLMKMAMELLTKDDWSWAKNILRARRGAGGDWYSAQNKNGEWEEIWSPVRAFALYTKLRMPLRTFQVRTMDDGSSDTKIFDETTGTMVPNSSPSKQGSAREPVQRGALQTVTDKKTGRTIRVVRLTTNKNADIDKDASMKGYTCPWAPDDVVTLLVELRQWQQVHNPISGPTAWRKLKEFQGLKTDIALAGIESCFLFRDPTDRTRRDEPIFDSKINTLWLEVLDELEERLKKQGIIGPDNQPIKLINTRDSRDKPSTPVYDLHTCRVSILTNLLETGEVSAEMLMKIVGHATVAMVLYYVKFNVAYISDCLSEADAKMLRDDQQNWIRYTRSKSLKDLSRAVAHNSDSGLVALNGASSASLMGINIGVCPVGGSLCHKGGPKISDRKDRDLNQAVPGGRSNCAGCRYVISGPPFLHGISCEANVRSFELAGLSRKLEKLEAAYELHDNERRACEAAGEPFLEHRNWERAANDMEEVEARLAQLGIEILNLWTLRDQVTRIIKERREEGGANNALVFGDIASVKTALEESTEFDLADRVCKASVIYESIAARGNLPQYANEFRAKRYDRMLRKIKLQPRFFDMDEETALYVGNQLSSFLMLKLGRKKTLQMMEEDATTDEFMTMVMPPEFRCEVNSALDAMVAKKFVLEPPHEDLSAKQLGAGE